MFLSWSCGQRRQSRDILLQSFFRNNRIPSKIVFLHEYVCVEADAVKKKMSHFWHAVNVDREHETRRKRIHTFLFCSVFGNVRTCSCHVYTKYVLHNIQPHRTSCSAPISCLSLFSRVSEDCVEADRRCGTAKLLTHAQMIELVSGQMQTQYVSEQMLSFH